MFGESKVGLGPDPRIKGLKIQTWGWTGPYGNWYFDIYKGFENAGVSGS